MAAMQHTDMDAHHHTGEHDQAPTHDQHGLSCNACGVCHLACAGFLTVAQIRTVDVPPVAGLQTPYLFTFSSITTLPLVPPPLSLA